MRCLSCGEDRLEGTKCANCGEPRAIWWIRPLVVRQPTTDLAIVAANVSMETDDEAASA